MDMHSVSDTDQLTKLDEVRITFGLIFQSIGTVAYVALVIYLILRACIG